MQHFELGDELEGVVVGGKADRVIGTRFGEGLLSGVSVCLWVSSYLSGSNLRRSIK